MDTSLNISSLATLELAALATFILAATTYLAFRLLSPQTGLRRWRGPGPDVVSSLAYTLAPTEAISREVLGLPQFADVETCEFFTGGGRQRVVLTLTQRSNTHSVRDVAKALEDVSRSLLEQSGADIVVVELSAQIHAPSDAHNWVAVRSSDNKGWHGMLPVGPFFIEGPSGLKPDGERRWEG